MRARISTRFADSRAADLSLAYGLSPLPALGTHQVTLDGVTLELRVLGASHQVVIGDWSETVACLPDRPGALPATSTEVVGDYTARFEARCDRPADFAATVSRIVADCEADGHSLVAEFPGSPLAVTALSARSTAAGVCWETWHAYPQAGELVWTSSVVSPL
ncbi:DUF2617 family protein [Actinophytocola oryzae]|uniref:Uncharacterized protein DUF2617 n=1 Tax=Actinophytocola oryzae TaxID=502181 RepID=A0A4R7VVN3_9PSEU|nr:DUF2617 family protein [Actinophytocola oryzae]TDV54083.1 uncharacterized protein DUF2617 [Actinophytocola oryzae]